MSIVSKRRDTVPRRPMGRPPLGPDRRDRQHTVRLSPAHSDRLREVLAQVREAEESLGVPERSRTSESTLIAAIVMRSCESATAIAGLISDAREAARR
jgi:hypothetical protein